MTLPDQDCTEPDCRLQTRYRRLTIAIALPTFVLVAVLAGVEYVLLRSHALQNLNEKNATMAAQLDNLARRSKDRVTQIKTWSETAWNRPAPAPRAAGYFSNNGASAVYTLDALPEVSRPGFGQLLWRGNNAKAASETLARSEDLFQLCKLNWQSAQELSAIYWLAADANQQFVGLYPWRASEALAEPGTTPGEALTWYFSGGRYRQPEAYSHPASGYWLNAQRQGNAVVVSYAAPIGAGIPFKGLIAADLPLTSIQSVLSQWASPIGRLLVLDAGNTLLADSSELRSGQIITLDSLELPDVNPENLDRISADDGLCRNCGALIAVQTLAEAPWKLVSRVEEAELQMMLWPQLAPYALILLALGATLWLSLFALRREFIDPALRLVNYLEQLVRDSNIEEPAVPTLWRPWTRAITRTFASHRDALQQLRAGEAFKSAIVENSMLAVISMDTAGRIKEFNRAAEQVFGLSAVSVVGRDLADTIIPERYREAHRTGLARHIRTRQSAVIGAHLELSALHADGHEFPVELTIFETPVGNESFYTAFVADHTQRKHAEQEVARQREALRQSEKLSAMGALLAGVAHELNNPLAILMGRAALLENKARDAKIREDAERIRVAADRCGRIVRTFLAMARQKPAERKPAHLNDAVTGAVELLGYGLRSAGIELNLSLDQSLTEVEMDVDQIGQVLVNLIVNAQHALSAQIPPRKLRIATSAEADQQYLRISDNGPGVPEELRDRIFDPFFTTKAEGCGTGIGLSVCRAIVREHGGELVLEESALGASFRVSIPASGSHVAARLTAASDVSIAHEGNVLVIDDEPEVAAVLADILRSAGYRVHVAANGKQALQWLETNPCDMLFSDVRMPDMDGITLWRALRNRHPQLIRHMALVTGDTLSAGIAPLLAETGLPCLEKPFSPDEVLTLAAKIET